MKNGLIKKNQLIKRICRFIWYVTTIGRWRSKKGKGLKILTPNKISTRLLVLLAQIKGGKYDCDKRSQNFLFWFWLENVENAKNAENLKKERKKRRKRTESWSSWSSFSPI